MNIKLTLTDIPDDIFDYLLFPLLDDLSIFYLEIILQRKKIPSMVRFPDLIHELIIKQEFDHYIWFEKYNALDHTKSMIYAAKYGQIKIIEYGRLNNFVFKNKIMNTAAQYGQLNCVKLLNKYGLDFSEQTISACASGNQVEIMSYLFSRHCKIDEEAYKSACRNGSLECLVYMFNHYGGKCYNEWYDIAASYGHINILKCIDSLTFIFHPSFFDKVIKYDHREVLRYFLTFKWYNSTMYLAACKYNNLAVLEILSETGADLNHHIKRECLEKINTPEIKEWLENH